MRMVATIALLALSVTAAEVYKLSRVKKVDTDLYRSGDTYIETRYCYHYAYSEDAVLKWNGHRGSIIWDNDTTCDVNRVFRK